MAVSASAEWNAILPERREERALELVSEQKATVVSIGTLPAHACTDLPLSFSFSLYLKTEAMEPL